MNQLVDRTIAALRSEHDRLAGLVRTATDEQLALASGAQEWTVAQVLSHLGSGAEIGRAPIANAAGAAVTAEDNQTIWDRWDASAPRVQAEGFLEHNGRWLDTVEALTPEQLGCSPDELHQHHPDEPAEYWRAVSRAMGPMRLEDIQGVVDVFDRTARCRAATD